MDPVERFVRRGEAQRRLRAQRRRVGMLRSRVVALSLIAFVVLWGVVFTQMATGNDPVLGAGATAAAKPGHGGRRTGDSDPGGGGAARVAEEAIATTDPEESEPQTTEPEYAEAEYEYVEPEPEPEYEYVEPEPVTTGAS